MDNDSIPQILLIEDDPFFSELLARKLREKSCLVTEKESLESARAVLDEKRFRVLCLDIVVLGMDGLKKLSELMTNDRLQNTAVLLLTDKETEAETITLSTNSALAHLIKSETTPDEIVSFIISLAARSYDTRRENN